MEFGVRDSLIPSVSSDQVLNPIVGIETPRNAEERADSSQISAPAGRGEFCFFWWFAILVQLSIALGNNRLGGASHAPNCHA